MITLYHHPICPLSRQIRIFLKELGAEFTMIKQDYWSCSKEFMEISPFGNVPVIKIDKDNLNLFGNYSIIEYFVERFEKFFLMPKDINDRALVRRDISWLNEKFYREVSKILIDEKMIRLLMRIGQPRSDFIQAAKKNLNQHLSLLSNNLEKNSYISIENISCSDLVGASHISIIDYFGEINWNNWPFIKEWYSIIKSRPSFQTILQDRIAGFTPPSYYSDLDF